MNRFLPLFVFVCLWFGCGRQSDHSVRIEEKGTYVIFDSLVRVTAKYDTNAWDFDVAVVHESDTFRIRSIPIYNENDSVKIADGISGLRAATGWKGEYFFVRSECGGGNAWNCDYDGVYKIQNGRLIFIGNISCGNGASPGAKYDGQYFRHLYDKFEGNDLTSHACAPGLWLVMTERGGKFLVDTEKTWEENREYYLENEKAISAFMKGKPRGASADELLEKLLQNAVAAKYCLKTDEVNLYLSYVNAGYKKQTAVLFEEIISRVIPGEYISQ